MPTTQNQKNKKYPEEYSVWARDKSKANTLKLMRKLEPVISASVRSYGGGDNKYSARARLMALAALDKYDPKQGVALNTYLHSQLRSLNRLVRERRNVIHIPENAHLVNRARALAESDLLGETGVQPTLSAIADKTGISLKKLKSAGGYGGSNPSSALLSEKGDDLVDHSDKDDYALWTDYVYHDQDERGKKVMEGITGYGGAPIRRKQALAEELGISAPALSQRIKKIADKLEEMPNAGV